MKPKICYRFVEDNLTSETGIIKWKIRKWNRVEGELKCCKNGLHASLTPLDSLKNVYGNKWFIAEYRGKIDKKNDKFCASEMRLIKEIPVMVIKRFALFCAKSCLKYYEKEYPDDKRVSECIRITELFLDGKTTLEELNTAKNAAWTAESAAWSAAGSAAESAAWSAAESAVWSARSAAESAESARSAESAVWSVRSAAESAAESAAWSAAESAESARSAAGKKQNKELLRLIKEYMK